MRELGGMVRTLALRPAAFLGLSVLVSASVISICCAFGLILTPIAFALVADVAALALGRPDEHRRPFAPGLHVALLVVLHRVVAYLGLLPLGMGIDSAGQQGWLGPLAALASGALAGAAIGPLWLAVGWSVWYARAHVEATDAWYGFGSVSRFVGTVPRAFQLAASSGTWSTARLGAIAGALLILPDAAAMAASGPLGLPRLGLDGLALLVWPTLVGVCTVASIVLLVRAFADRRETANEALVPDRLAMPLLVLAPAVVAAVVAVAFAAAVPSPMHPLWLDDARRVADDFVAATGEVPVRFVRGEADLSRTEQQELSDTGVLDIARGAPGDYRWLRVRPYTRVPDPRAPDSLGGIRLPRTSVRVSVWEYEIDVQADDGGGAGRISIRGRDPLFSLGVLGIRETTHGGQRAFDLVLGIVGPDRSSVEWRRAVVNADGVRLDDDAVDRLLRRIGFPGAVLLLLALALVVLVMQTLLSALRKAGELRAPRWDDPNDAAEVRALPGVLRGEDERRLLGVTSKASMAEPRVPVVVEAEGGGFRVRVPEPAVAVVGAFEAAGDGTPVMILGRLRGLGEGGFREGTLPWPKGATLVIGDQRDAQRHLVQRAVGRAGRTASWALLSLVVGAGWVLFQLAS